MVQSWKFLLEIKFKIPGTLLLVSDKACESAQLNFTTLIYVLPWKTRKRQSTIRMVFIFVYLKVL